MLWGLNETIEPASSIGKVWCVLGRFSNLFLNWVPLMVTLHCNILFFSCSFSGYCCFLMYNVGWVIGREALSVNIWLNVLKILYGLNLSISSFDFALLSCLYMKALYLPTRMPLPAGQSFENVFSQEFKDWKQGQREC